MQFKDVFPWVNELASSAVGSALADIVPKMWRVFSQKNMPAASPDLDAEHSYGVIVSHLPEDKRKIMVSWLYLIEHNAPGVSNQKEDFVIRIKRAYDKDAQKTLEMLSFLADLPSHEERTKAAVGLFLMKEEESDYTHFSDYFQVSDEELRRRQEENRRTWDEVGQLSDNVFRPAPSFLGSIIPRPLIPRRWR